MKDSFMCWINITSHRRKKEILRKYWYGKCCPCAHYDFIWGNVGLTPVILNLSSRWKWVVRLWWFSPIPLSISMKLVRHQSCYNVSGDETNLFSLPGIDPRFLGYTIPAQTILLVRHDGELLLESPVMWWRSNRWWGNDLWRWKLNWSG